MTGRPALKPCLVCGALTSTSRCPTRTRQRATPTEQARRAQAVTDHRLRHGPWCPGHGRKPHPSNDLTADHLAAWARTGSEDGTLQVSCRSCNSRRGNHA